MVCFPQGAQSFASRNYATQFVGEDALIVPCFNKNLGAGKKPAPFACNALDKSAPVVYNHIV